MFCVLTVLLGHGRRRSSQHLPRSVTRAQWVRIRQWLARLRPFNVSPVQLGLGQLLLELLRNRLVNNAIPVHGVRFLARQIAHAQIVAQERGLLQPEHRHQVNAMHVALVPGQHRAARTHLGIACHVAQVRIPPALD